MLDIYDKKLKKEGQVYLLCKVIPNSDITGIKSISKNNMDGRETEVVLIKIAAPADKNKANNALIKFLAQEFGVLKEDINIISGKTEHLKLIRIKNNN